MTTHILIELDHPAFEVTRESIENLPDWVNEPVRGSGLSGFRHFHQYFQYGHYLIAYHGKIEVCPPEDVAKYLKQNPYEACAKVAERYPTNDMRDGMVAKGCAQAIRQLEQKEIGK